MLLVRREAHVVHARSVAARHRRVVHGGLAAHPRGVDGALFVLDVLGDAESEILHVLHGPRHVGGDLVEVVQPHELAGDVQVVAPRHPLDVVGLVEEFVREAERVDHAHRVSDARDEPALLSANITAQLREELDGPVEVLGGAHPVRERPHRGDLALAQHEVVVDELLGRAQVDRLVVLFRDVQTEDVDVELAGCREVGDHELHVRAAEDIRRGCLSGSRPGCRPRSGPPGSRSSPRR